MNAQLHPAPGREISRGARWLQALAPTASYLPGFPDSVAVADGELAGGAVRWIALVPDATSRFPRARNGEAGLLEGWSLARAVREVIEADRNAQVKRAIVAIVDTPSQAYGRREEALGIHQSLAGAVAAYADARLAGHPVVALIVGRAMSGAFLAHGYQANRIIALDDKGVLVHAMGKEAAARITMRTVEDLEALASTVPPMAYDIENFATLGILWRLIDVESASEPMAADVHLARDTILSALADIQRDQAHDLSSRRAGANRKASADVRACLTRQWQA
ncbi:MULTISPECIES: biotin-independent malonate decarboxylase subunit gamma [Cupriavidus]|uniref:biotin-independent malonate decarboxylase subunit gamma n=1 Tax=Cupriavidus sp. DF5525 TaxID=3160989 RepID=UPI0003B004F6|nr:malonate decarboxylase subunit gamma [Ralstonia pickettii DTP0602]